MHDIFFEKGKWMKNDPVSFAVKLLYNVW